jgi:catechol 2,3-dioxygenase-like lactoylglutathione lyase family enzyme
MVRPKLDQQVTFLYARDLEASARFYGELLGLPFALDQGVCRIYQVAPGAFLGVCRRDEAPAEHGRAAPVIVTLVAQDVDGWHRYLAERGIVFEQGPQHNQRYNIYHCFLRDPDGYLLEIQRFLDPVWPQPVEPPAASEA